MDDDFTKFLKETGLTVEQMEEAARHLPPSLPPDPNEHYYVASSDIHGEGVFAKYDVDGFIGVMWSDHEWYHAGRYANHSATPNCRPLLTDGVMILIGKADKDEELTVDYRDVKEILSGEV